MKKIVVGLFFFVFEFTAAQTTVIVEDQYKCKGLNVSNVVAICMNAPKVRNIGEIYAHSNIEFNALAPP